MSDDQSLLNFNQDDPPSVERGVGDLRVAPIRQERPDWAKHLGIGEDDDLSLDDLMKLVPLDLH
jgi:hypothetical protein